MWKIKETKKIKEKMIDEEEEDDDKEKTTTSVALMSVSYQNQKSNETFLSLSLIKLSGLCSSEIFLFFENDDH